MSRYRRNPNTAGRIVDGLAFVVTPDDNKLHTLNGSATLLWTLSKAGLDLEAAGRALVETYEIDEATARSDAQACLDDLVARAILVLAVIGLRLPGLHVAVHSEFEGALGGLPATYEVAAGRIETPDLVIELVRAPARNRVPPLPDHPRFHARVEGGALIVERPDCLGRIDVNASPLHARFELSDDPYALEGCVRVAIGVALPRHGGLILHASAVRWGGEAKVFTGVSGAGKSTIAALLSSSFPRCERLADELVILARSPDGWRLHVPPFLGISDLPRGEWAPLQGIHLIAQAPAPRIEPRTPAAALRELLRHVVVYAAEPATTAHVLDLAAALVTEIPCYRLEFANDASVGQVLGIT